MYKKLSNKTAAKASISLQKRALAIFVAIALACTGVAAPASAFADEVVEPLELVAPEAAVAEDAADEAEDFAAEDAAEDAVEEDEAIEPLAAEVAPASSEEKSVAAKAITTLDAVSVKNATELLNAVNNATQPRVITLTQNISLVGSDRVTITNGKNITLKGNFVLTGSAYEVIDVYTGGTFVLDGVTVTNAGTGYGIWNDGIFTMKSGKVINCKNSGVYNTNTFVLQGGTISGNKSSGSGAGVRTTGNSAFRMSGGAITGNTSGSEGAGAYCGGSLVLSGGTISNNTSAGDGGGLSIRSTFTMSGGTVSGNTAAFDGGGIDLFNGNFSITGGTISNNTAKGSGTAFGRGGGIYCQSATFAFNKATVSGNTAGKNGGGIYCTSTTFTMSGGTITGNKTTGADGGGLAIGFTDKKIKLNGGIISNNTAKGNGGGLAMDSYYFKNLTIAKAVKFSGNKAKDARKPSPREGRYYVAKIKCTSWSSKFVQGYNNYDISNPGGTKTKVKATKPKVGGKSKITAYTKYGYDYADFPIKGGGDFTISVKKGSTKVKIDKGGRLTIPKGHKKGTFKVTIIAKNKKGTGKKTVTIVVK
ncbi:MAG: hypothetical protein FWG00_03355 [Coriobacteriia bacterium]|jgi:predicted outer membrane repeat protein|nr:hypothetical protein [Coriobacteriia bacterium]